MIIVQLFAILWVLSGAGAAGLVTIDDSATRAYEDLQVALNLAFAEARVRECPGCLYAAEEFEQFVGNHPKERRSLLVERVALLAIERLETEILNARTVNEVIYQSAYGRFLHVFLLRFLDRAMKDRPFREGAVLLHRLFKTELISVQGVLLLSLQIGDEQLPLLLEIAANPHFGKLRTSLAARLVPRLGPAARVALARELWTQADAVQRRQIELMLGNVIRREGLSNPNRALMLWMATTADAKLREVAFDQMHLPGLEKDPNLIWALLVASGDETERVFRALGARICDEELEDWVLRYWSRASSTARSEIASWLPSAPECPSRTLLMTLAGLENSPTRQPAATPTPLASEPSVAGLLTYVPRAGDASPVIPEQEASRLSGTSKDCPDWLGRNGNS